MAYPADPLQIEEEEEKDDKPVENEAFANAPSVMAAPHPLGGIQLVIRTRDDDGNVVLKDTRVDIEEAAVLIVHLQAIITMLFSSVYAQQAKLHSTATVTADPRIIRPGQR